MRYCGPILLIPLVMLLIGCDEERSTPHVEAKSRGTYEIAAAEQSIPKSGETVTKNQPVFNTDTISKPLVFLDESNVRSAGGGGSSSPYPFDVPGGSGGRGRNNDSDMHMLLHWNEMAIDASGVDHQQPPPVDLAEAFAVREQMGPGRASRAMAIVHIAMFEAINAIKGGYESYLGLERVMQKASVEAAIARASHDTLAALFPSQASDFAAQLILDLAEIPDGEAKDRGLAIGEEAAAAILALRANDGSAHAEPVVGVDYSTNDAPGRWRKDPISNIPIALGAFWSQVSPFVMTSASQFRTLAPPALNSPEYTAAYNEVKRLGGDGIDTPTERTQEETEIGIFWAYDGVPNLCAPPRLFNQIAVIIAKQMHTDMVGVARLLAIINVAMADAAIAIWESKYHWDVWRPITAIREADPGTGPSSIGDGNPDTIGDVNFIPLGAPASNMNNVPDFTPPFPAYPSGHAGFGGAIFQILRKFYGTDDIQFSFTSDEMNGITHDRFGNVRAYSPRNFASFSEAEEENGQSRIYLGIHWSFDKTEGIVQGNAIADYVWDHLFQPLH